MLYTALKFTHVVAVIVWVGGAIAMTIMNQRLARARGGESMAALAGASAFFGQAVLGPAAGLTLLAGLATALSAGFQMRSLWIIWGFGAILLSVALGATLIRITTRRIGALAASGGPGQVASLQRRLGLLNLLNIVLLLSAVWAMVAKPSL